MLADNKELLALVEDWDWYEPEALDPFDFTDYIDSVLTDDSLKLNRARVEIIKDFVFENIESVRKAREARRF